MPRAPRGPCTYDLCTERATRGARCAKHRRGSEGHPFEDFYRSRQWRDLSARVRREEPICPGWGPRSGTCGRPTEQADHIVSLVDGGAALARENVQALCGWCHSKKTQSDRAKRRRPS